MNLYYNILLPKNFQFVLPISRVVLWVTGYNLNLKWVLQLSINLMIYAMVWCGKILLGGEITHAFTVYL